MRQIDVYFFTEIHLVSSLPGLTTSSQDTMCMCMDAAFIINEIIFSFVVTHAWVLSYQFICNI